MEAHFYEIIIIYGDYFKCIQMRSNKSSSSFKDTLIILNRLKFPFLEMPTWKRPQYSNCFSDEIEKMFDFKSNATIFHFHIFSSSLRILLSRFTNSPLPSGVYSSCDSRMKSENWYVNHQNKTRNRKKSVKRLTSKITSHFFSLTISYFISIILLSALQPHTNKCVSYKI